MNQYVKSEEDLAIEKGIGTGAEKTLYWKKS